MGEHAALTAVEWEIGRAEQDELALESHHRLAAAYDRGFFDDLVTPFHGLARDEGLRPDTTLEQLARLRTVFGGRETATMTAGNSTPLSRRSSCWRPTCGRSGTSSQCSRTSPGTRRRPSTTSGDARGC
jgi:acetyl-CoA C-acetyltransferase